RRLSRALRGLKAAEAASLQRTILVERSLTNSARTKDDRGTRQRKKRAPAVTDGGAAHGYQNQGSCGRALLQDDAVPGLQNRPRRSGGARQCRRAAHARI